MTLKTPARPCTAHDVTWSSTGGQCLNCGGTGPNCYSIEHAPQPGQPVYTNRETAYGKTTDATRSFRVF